MRSNRIFILGTAVVLAGSMSQAAAGQRAQTKSRTVSKPQTTSTPVIHSPSPTDGALAVTAAIIMKDMSVRPLPAYALELVSADDSTRRIAIRTGLDGHFSGRMPIGHYTLRGATSVALNDSTYRWNVPISVEATGTSVELTNMNALAMEAPRSRQVAPERAVYERVRGSVFKVEAGLGHGSGFLARIPGVSEALIVTNDHVVADDSLATVYLDTLTRVPAVVVARDRQADLAVLRLPASRCASCLALPLAVSPAGEDIVVAGERIIALGFPLNQELTLTTGIASSVRAGAIITDAVINHGNSGGPMLNLAGEVVGVNAFGDATTQGGPGIAGAIVITRLNSLVSQLTSALTIGAAPVDRTLPAMPRAEYPLDSLKSIADRVEDPRDYIRAFYRGADHFELNIATPVVYRVAIRQFEQEVGEERRKREAAAGISKDQAYSETKEIRDWEQYVGNPFAPVIAIAVSPRVTETGGSVFLRSLAAAGGSTLTQASLVFDADVRGAHFYRNGIELEPFFGGHAPAVENIETRFVKLKDVADRGYYVVPPELFAPDSDGAPARVQIAVADLKRPQETSGTEIDGELSARIWNQFVPYFQARGEHVTVANPRMRSPKADMECADGVCVLKKQ